MMVTSDFRLEVEIWQFHACAMKIMQYKLKPRFARFQLECPMTIALRAPSCEYISRFALRLGFVLAVDWNT